MTWQDRSFQECCPLVLESCAGLGNSKVNSVLVAVATSFPEASMTGPSVNPIRDPASTTLPTAVSGPLVRSGLFYTPARRARSVDAASVSDSRSLHLQTFL
jgi:hypothetical protein